MTEAILSQVFKEGGLTEIFQAVAKWLDENKEIHLLDITTDVDYMVVTIYYHLNPAIEE